ncbi:MAG: acyl-CoA dehydrogenase family protein [Caldilineaceae bacterium]|nr:acyl-CoA dehydrogenase family protein [Caldilineaceae bacterium]
MDFQIPAPLVDLRARVRALVEEELIPLEPAFLHTEFRELLPRLDAVRAQVKAAGLWAPFMPAAWGGMGLSLLDYAFVAEELGRSLLGPYAFNCQAPDVGNMEILHAFGTEEQQARWLKPLVAGEIRSCFAMTEPEFAGSNPVYMETTAVKDGADYVINGHKWFTTAADGAAFAVVMAVTDADAPRHRRASQIIVPTDTPGYRLVRNIAVMGDVGSDHATHGEVRLEACRVPQANLLGEEGAGFAIAQERLGPGRIHHCMRWIGICERALELMCRHAVTRRLSSRATVADQQAVQHWIAESRAEIDAARLMVLQAAWTIDNEGAYAARVQISTIKFFVAGVLQRVLDRAIQAHGALGMTDDTPLAYWYRHERAARIYDGPDEVHKMVVARRVLGEYREA